jgi:type IV pilus assembly protein PilO
MPTGRILQEKRALVWPIVLTLVANIALFVFVVYPLSRKVANGEQQANAAAAALAEARRSHAAARATVSGKSEADEELQRFYGEVLPPDLSAARGMTFVRLDQLAQKSGLRLRDQRATTSAERQSTLNKMTITVSLSGEYGDIRAFIHELETAPDFLVLENVDLSQSSREERGIDVTVQIATYFRAGGHGNN